MITVSIAKRHKRANEPLTVERDSLTIGRDETNDVCIRDNMISNVHCRISRTEEGYEVTDLDSANGTTIDGRVLVSGTPQAVLADETITLAGEYHVQIRDPNARSSKIINPEVDEVRAFVEQRAEEWILAGRDQSLLLSSAELKRAESWIMSANRGSAKPKKSHRSLYYASDRAQRKRRQRMVGLVAACSLALVGGELIGQYAIAKDDVLDQLRQDLAQDEAKRLQDKLTESNRRAEEAQRSLAVPRVALPKALDALRLAYNADASSAHAQKSMKVLREALARPKGRHLDGHEHPIRVLTWLDDETLFTVDSTRKSVLWRCLGDASPCGESEDTRDDNSAQVKFAAVSDNNSVIALARDDNKIEVWKLESSWECGRSTKRNATLVEDHENTLTSIALNSDGTWLVSGDKFGVVRLRDLGSKRTRELQRGKDAKVSAVGISDDGSYLAAGWENGATLLWSLKNGEPRKQTKIPASDSATRFEFRSSKALGKKRDTSSTWLLSGYRDGTVRADKIGRKGGLSKSSVSDRSGVDAPVSEIHLVDRVYRSKSADQRVTEALVVRDRFIDVFTFTKRGLSLDTPIQFPVEDTIAGATFGSDGTPLLVARQDGVALSWRSGSVDADPVSFPNLSHGVTAVSLAPNGEHAALGHKDGSIHLWNLTHERGGADSIIGLGHEAPVLSVDATTTGEKTRIVSGSVDGRAYTWTPSGARIKPEFRLVAEGAGELKTIALSASGDQALAGAANGSVWWWRFDGAANTSTCGHSPLSGAQLVRRAVADDADDSEHSGSSLQATPEVVQVSFILEDNRDGPVALAAFSDGVLMTWDASGTQGQDSARPAELGRLELGSYIHTVVVDDHVQNPRVAAAGDSESIAIVKIEQMGKSLSSGSGYESTSESKTALALDSDKTWLASGDSGGYVRLTSWKSAEASDQEFRLKNEIRSIDFRTKQNAEDVNLVVVGTFGGEVSVGRDDDGKFTFESLTSTDKSRSIVRSAKFSPDGKFLIVVYENGSAKIWSVDTKRDNLREMFVFSSDFIGHDHGEPINDLVFSDDTKFAITAGNDGTVRFWPISPEALIEHAERQFPRWAR